MAIRVSVDIRDVARAFNALEADMEWVGSSTINDVLKLAQDAQYTTMRENFTIRNEAFLKYSVRLQFAKRGEYEGSIYIANLPGKQTSNIWEKFEGGGVKTPTKGKNIAVPTNDAWPNRSRVKPQRNKPRNLDRSFVVKKGTNTFIATRKGKRSRLDGSGRDANIKLMYVLEPNVRIPDKLNFYATTVPVIQKNIIPVATKLLQKSIDRINRG